jgi:hypothetical protein
MRCRLLGREMSGGMGGRRFFFISIRGCGGKAREARCCPAPGTAVARVPGMAYRRFCALPGHAAARGKVRPAAGPQCRQSHRTPGPPAARCAWALLVLSSRVEPPHAFSVLLSRSLLPPDLWTLSTSPRSARIYSAGSVSALVWRAAVVNLPGQVPSLCTSTSPLSR